MTKKKLISSVNKHSYLSPTGRDKRDADDLEADKEGMKDC